MLARVGLDGKVCIRGFSVDGGSELPIAFLFDKDIKEGYGAIFFVLASKLDSRVNFVQALSEVRRRVRRAGGAAAQSWPGVGENSPRIVHVDRKMTGDLNVATSGDLGGLLNGKDHPVLAH